MNIRIKITYDGTNFYGFQKQDRGRTIEKVLTKAVENTVKHPVKLFYSGRTDSGVHAFGQYANFYTESTIDIGNLPKVINYHLPTDISVVEAKYVDDNFHSRYSAKGKFYRYIIYNNKYRNALFENRAWQYPHKIDMEILEKSLSYLVGEHDFKSFMGRYATVKDTIRIIHKIEVNKVGDVINIDFYGKSFLKNMVRIIVGTSVQISSKNKSPEITKEALVRKERISAGMTAPACGLYLMDVYFRGNK
ncbi:tRNA pseudouridine(38-40) synthase TruA [Peptoniphilus duerdenii]|uniref:tRNA pseudouridine synthase A n=1 Tax=Peptoniphilus duerdenii ATCC BAA-1640 TaxID=862517 RepID=E0NN06_9FIRM|nr:tRNA pseudouridine(38-40) synthase TruA [Peptoniphilus duerdenii]EFM24679.1 tRNA pseudouridine synthase A [Peptoniphilus duerdenii ATCC BAA-1640]